MITLDDLMNDLNHAKELAKTNQNPNALVTATMAQAKLLGLDKPQLSTNEYQMKYQKMVDEISDLIGELSDE